MNRQSVHRTLAQRTKLVSAVLNRWLSTDCSVPPGALAPWLKGLDSVIHMLLPLFRSSQR